MGKQKDVPVIEQVTCLRCGFKWFPRTEAKPVLCRGCHSPYWHLPRIYKPRAKKQTVEGAQ